MGRGAHHLRSSLAPATGKSLIAGASCASSLLAGAVVVTTRLAQKCCRSDAAKLAQVVRRLVPLRVSGVRRAGANCLHAVVAHHGWKRWVLRLGQGAEIYDWACGQNRCSPISRRRIATLRWRVLIGGAPSDLVAARLCPQVYVHLHALRRSAFGRSGRRLRSRSRAGTMPYGHQAG